MPAKPKKKPLTKLPKPKRMFVMAEVDATGLSAKDVRTAILARVQGHPLVRILQVDVNVARAPRPAELLPPAQPSVSPSGEGNVQSNRGDGDSA